MQAYIANLLLEKSATTFVIVSDDATTAGIEEKISRGSSRDPPLMRKLSDREKDKWLQPSSLKDELSSAPFVPSRRGSNDSCEKKKNKWQQQSSPEVSSAPMVPSRRGSNESLRGSNESLNGIYNKFEAASQRSMKYKREKKANPWQNAPAFKQCNEGLEDQTQVDSDDSYQDMKQIPEQQPGLTKKKRSSWDDLRRMLKNINPPTLPLRKKSGDNLVLQAEEGKKTRTSSRRCISLESAILPTDALRKGSYLDNAIMIVDKQVKLHGERQSSLDNALLASDQHMRQGVQRSSSLDNPFLKHQKKRHAPQRIRSLENAFSSLKGAQKRRGSNEGIGSTRVSFVSKKPGVPEPERQGSFKRSSSFTKRILSKLNSPKFQQPKRVHFQELSPDLFQLPNSNIEDKCNDDSIMAKQSADDFRFGKDSRSIAPLLPCRQISDVQLVSLHSDRA